MLYWKNGDESLSTDDRISLSQFLIQKFHTTSRLAFYSSTGMKDITWCWLDHVVLISSSAPMFGIFCILSWFSAHHISTELLLFKLSTPNLSAHSAEVLSCWIRSFWNIQTSGTRLEQTTMQRAKALRSHWSDVWHSSLCLSSGWYNRLYINFTLRRHIFFFLLQTYFPATLMVMLSWVSFWIDRRAVPARVSLGKKYSNNFASNFIW